MSSFSKSEVNSWINLLLVEKLSDVFITSKIKIQTFSLYNSDDCDLKINIASHINDKIVHSTHSYILKCDSTLIYQLYNIRMLTVLDVISLDGFRVKTSIDNLSDFINKFRNKIKTSELNKFITDVDINIFDEIPSEKLIDVNLLKSKYKGYFNLLCDRKFYIKLYFNDGINYDFDLKYNKLLPIDHILIYNNVLKKLIDDNIIIRNINIKKLVRKSS